MMGSRIYKHSHNCILLYYILYNCCQHTFFFQIEAFPISITTIQIVPETHFITFEVLVHVYSSTCH
uniref:Uncharacterized protein n=1 Tax=Arundo donax TaxID=35708 RepID=A0A0A9GND9_ARUDO